MGYASVAKRIVAGAFVLPILIHITLADAAAGQVDCGELFIPVTTANSEAVEECAPPGDARLHSYKLGDECRLNVDYVHPTQPAVGVVAVNCKRDKLARKDAKDLDKYLKKGKRVVPTVIGPDGNYYITDHHHLSTAVYKRLQELPELQKDVRLYAQIVGNFSGSVGGNDPSGGMANFWHSMAVCNNAFPYYLGHPINPLSHMPASLAAMKDDPFRTLSRWVRDAYGYIKPSRNPANFLEFLWANQFRPLAPNLPLCELSKEPEDPACRGQITKLRSGLEPAIKQAQSYASVAWIGNGNCAADLQGQPAGLIACGYNPHQSHVEVDKYITADRGCETAAAYVWEKPEQEQPPQDGIVFYDYAKGYATATHTVCRVQDGKSYSGWVDGEECSYVDSKDKEKSNKDFEVLTGVQTMYVWNEYTQAIADDDQKADKFFADAIPVDEVKHRYICGSGDKIGWVKMGKKTCHLDEDGVKTPFLVLSED